MPVFTSGGSSVTSANIVDDEIINADIDAAAAIAISKLAPGPFEVLADVSLGSGAATISSGTFAAREFLRLYVYVPSFTSTSDIAMNYNGDSSAIYSYSTILLSAAPTAGTSQTQTRIQSNPGNSAAFHVVDIMNVLARTKYHTSIGHQSDQPCQSSGSWNNTVAQITSIVLTTGTAFATGTRLLVLGAKMS